MFHILDDNLGLVLVVASSPLIIPFFTHALFSLIVFSS